MRSFAWGVLLFLGFASFACVNWVLTASQNVGARPAACPVDEACSCDGLDYMSPNHPWKRDRENMKLADSPRRLLWFIQISDIHVSQYQDPQRVEDFASFCAETVKAIRPSVVVASGDLTDAKTDDVVGSRQWKKEWEAYHTAIAKSEVLKTTPWLDLRGNHDAFNVFDVVSPENLFGKYSVQGQRHLRSYTHTVTKDGDNYTFVALDATPNPGLKKPFNFVGMLLEKEWDVARNLERQSRCSSYSIWFGHYPTSSVLSPNPGLRWLLRSSLVYLSGHFHTFGGLVPAMHAVHRPYGNLELEVGDWKFSRIFRVVAVDHGLVSHAAATFGEWPLVVVTNPKDARYLLPLHEPLDLIPGSTHVRALVFSSAAVTSVRYRVNSGEWVPMNRSAAEPSLFVAPWLPGRFAEGLHDLEVSAEDELGRSNVVGQQFSLDRTPAPLGILGRIILSGNVTAVFQALFGLALFVAVFPLCLVRVMHYLILSGRMSASRVLARKHTFGLRRLWLLSTIDGLFFPLVLFPLYLTVGPWFIGEVVDGHVGATFAWGTIVSGRYVPPGALTFAFGFWQMLLYQIPLVFSLASVVHLRYEHVAAGKLPALRRFLTRNSPIFLLVLVMSLFAYLFGIGFGSLALFLGFMRTYSVLLAVVLWVYALRLPKEAFLRAELVRSLVGGEALQ